MSKLLVTLLTWWLVFGPLAFEAQALLSSSVLDDSRAVDFTTAGVAGGIPTRTIQCGSTIGVLGTVSAAVPADPINTAIQNCKGTSHVVQLSAGHYYLNSAVQFTDGTPFSAWNLTVRGQGPDQTILEFVDPFVGPCMFCINDFRYLADSNCFLPSPTQIANWTAGYASGATQITLDTITGPNWTLQPNMMITLDQLDNPTSDFNNYVPFTTSSSPYALFVGNGTRTGRMVAELHTVVSITGSGPYTVTITPPLAYHGWNSNGNNTPQAFWCGNPPGTSGGFNSAVSGIGVENLTIINSTSTSGQGAGPVNFIGAINSWLKNVVLVNGVYSMVWMRQAVGIEIRDSYLFHTNNAASCLKGGTMYGIAPEFAGFVKVENNILQQLCSAIMAQPCFMCVFGYNYTIGDYTVGGTGGSFGYAFNPGHVGSTHTLLFEGNITNGMLPDHWNDHGINGGFWISHRNYYSGQANPGVSTFDYPVMHQGYNRMGSYVANVLGNNAGGQSTYQSIPGAMNTTSIWSIGFGCQDGTFVCSSPDDTNTVNSLLRWYNYDYVTGTTRCVNAEVPSPGTSPYTQFIPGSCASPNSFYLAAKPSWCTGSCVWPMIGPDVTGGYDASGHVSSTPARTCYVSVMHGSTSGTSETSPLTFNANTCYSAAGTPPSAPTGVKIQ